MYQGKRIDAHNHCVFDDDWERIHEFFEERHIVKMACISGVVKYSKERVDIFKAMSDSFPEKYNWGTYLPIPDFTISDEEYAKNAIEHLKQQFEAGAYSVKIHAFDIGLITKKPDGSFLQIDDSMFTPIFNYIAEEGKVLILHVTEPWTRFPRCNHKSKVKKLYRPFEKDAFFRKKDIASYWKQIDAQEAVLQKHPNLLVLSAHLAGLDHDISRVGELLDKYPNLIVDTSGRRRSMAIQNPAKIQRFIVKYQDRILWGLDLYNSKKMSEMSDEEKKDFYKSMADAYRYEFNYYESRNIVKVGNFTAQGLSLPDDVLEKIYYKNAKELLRITTETTEK